MNEADKNKNFWIDRNIVQASQSYSRGGEIPLVSSMYNVMDVSV